MAHTKETTPPKTPRRFYLLALLGLVGIGLSVSLTQHFFEVRGGTGGFRSFCNMSTQMNCDVVAASSYAELIPGFPLAIFAAGFFALLFALSLFGLSDNWRREAIRGLFVMTAGGALLCLSYLFVMSQVLHTFCLFCLGVDATVLTSLGVVLSLKPESTKKHALEFSKWKTFCFVGLGCFLVPTVFLKSMDTMTLKASDVDEYFQSAINSPVLAVNACPDFASMGLPNAPITIVKFADFQCPSCKLGAHTLHTLLSRFPDKVRVVFRNYPLDPTCNRSVQHTMHSAACEAARVAVCARKQGKFEQVYELLFDNQEHLAPGKPTELAARAGVDTQALATCIASQETETAIQKDIEEANTLGLRSTPTYLINGHKVEGALPLEVWVRIVEHLLRTNSTPAAPYCQWP